jgi:peptidoglycan hydrolase-like protein with peptidoglycan-binding domain
VAKALRTRLSEVPARTWPNVISSSTGPVVRVVQQLLRTPRVRRDGQRHIRRHHGRRGPGLPGAPRPAPAGLGEVTNATWDALVPPLDARSTGDAVLGLQSILLPKGYAVAPTGVVDDGTRDAVRQLQRLHGLPPTGTVDVATWCAVVGGIVRQEFTRALPNSK